MTASTVGTVAVLLPDDWWVIDLEDDAARVAAVEDVVARQFAGTDQLAGLRRSLRSELLSTTAEASRGGGVLMAISVQDADTLPVPASLTVLRQPGTLAQGEQSPLVKAIVGAHQPDQSIDLAHGECGQVLRRVRTTRATSSVTGDSGFDSVVADYWVEPTAGQGLLYLVFSSPLVGARDALLDIFDAIVASVRVLSAPEDVDADPSVTVLGER